MSALKEIENINKLDTTNVTSMEFMFRDCTSLTDLDVSKFNTSNVTSMSSMFDGCENLTNLDVSKFDTGKVTDMHGMFYNCSKLENILVGQKWIINEGVNIEKMFINCGVDHVTLKEQ